jgi:hypothetical protein
MANTQHPLPPTPRVEQFARRAEHVAVLATEIAYLSRLRQSFIREIAKLERRAKQLRKDIQK